MCLLDPQNTEINRTCSGSEILNLQGGRFVLVVRNFVATERMVTWELAMWRLLIVAAALLAPSTTAVGRRISVGVDSTTAACGSSRGMRGICTTSLLLRLRPLSGGLCAIGHGLDFISGG